MLKGKKILVWMALPAAIFIEGCISDGGTYIPPGISGNLYLQDGTPAVNAEVALYPVDYVPGNNAAQALKTYASRTDHAGRFHFSQDAGIAQGKYNVLGRTVNSKDSLFSFSDSVAISTDIQEQELPSDTLKVPGSITGKVLLQPGEDSATVQLLGTYHYTTVGPDGVFTFKNVGQGTYTLAVNSTPLSRSDTIVSGLKDTLPEPITPKPNLFYSQNPLVYTVGVAIPNNTPSSTGGVVVSYSAPSLPAGLTINSTTGVISGTPTIVSAPANYTVTATNAAGSATTVVNIAVNAALTSPAGLSYSMSSAVYTVGVPIPNNAPSSTGGVVASYSAPSLPAGLIINSTTGVISGTPTAASTAKSYTVMAANAAGSTNVSVTLTVISNTAGVIWTPRNPGVTDDLYSVTWTGTQFVAVGGVFDNPSILTSRDGAAWVPQVAGTPWNLSSVVWTNNQLVAVGGNSILTSSDGVTWMPQVAGTPFTPASVIWTASQLVAVGYHTIMTSPNGTAWTGYETNGNLRSVTWTGSTGSPQAGGQLVAVGDSGAILTSSDGVTWTPRNSGVTRALESVTWTGTQLIAVGGSGIILTSSDGVTWTSRNSGTTNALSSVIWMGNQFVAVGANGTILTSQNGTTWISRSSGTSVSLESAVWTGGQLVAVGVNGVVLTSQ